MRLKAPSLDNGWLGVEGALVNEDSGVVHYFALGTEHYSGTDEGEAWAEGDRDAEAFLGRLPAGRYGLRLDVGVEPAHVVPGPFTVELTSQVPSSGRPVLLIFLLLLPALAVTIAGWSFERRRWSESDHA